jgi:branched-chain amino acid transport system permease protein
MALLYFCHAHAAGRLTCGLRENSHRLRFLGYNVHGLGMLVFAISAMFSGMAGGLQVVSNESANYVVFDPGLSAAVMLNTYIGGVKVFLGPAFGAALMTFFGYAVSDLTQSWLLYQGILFVLVMMFMPSGLAGLPGTTGRLRQRFGLARTMPLVLLSVGAALLLSMGGAFAVELLQRIFSQDYRAVPPRSRAAHGRRGAAVARLVARLGGDVGGAGHAAAGGAVARMDRPATARGAGRRRGRAEEKTARHAAARTEGVA